MSRLLVAEDEERISRFLAKGLGSDGHAVTVAADGTQALVLAMSGQFELMVLDVGLPGLDGWAVLSALRRSGSRMPVVVLTARAAPGDAVAALNGGADDYMAKPFAFEELRARVRLRLRSADVPDEMLSCGTLSLDLRTRRAVSGGRSVELTAREFALTETLLRHCDQVLSREQLLSIVWGFDFDPGSNVVDVYVRYLRRKLGADVIETVRNVGYRLRPSTFPELVGGGATDGD